MSTIIPSICRRINPGRMVAVAILVSFGAYLLFAFACDLPPYESETGPERLCAITSGILSWPVLALARLLPDHTPGILMVPVFVLPGVFWAAVFESFLIAKNARRA